MKEDQYLKYLRTYLCIISEEPVLVTTLHKQDGIRVLFLDLHKLLLKGSIFSLSCLVHNRSYLWFPSVFSWSKSTRKVGLPADTLNLHGFIVATVQTHGILTAGRTWWWAVWPSLIVLITFLLYICVRSRWLTVSWELRQSLQCIFCKFS